jgi:hypothetical protein
LILITPERSTHKVDATHATRDPSHFDLREAKQIHVKGRDVDHRSRLRMTRVRCGKKANCQLSHRKTPEWRYPSVPAALARPKAASKQNDR